MRSYLLVRIEREDELAAARSSGADALVLDLGDWSDVEGRGRARAAARRFLLERRGVEAGPAVFVLAAPLASAEIDGDLEAIVPAGADGVFLPQACGGASVQHLSAKLAAWEAESGCEDGAVRIAALATQTPDAFFQLGGYAGASRRLRALAFDMEALGPALGVRSARTADGGLAAPFALARASLLFAAAAAGAAAIDAPFSDVGDENGLREDCLAARRDGFSGKLAIHASQIRLINDSF